MTIERLKELIDESNNIVFFGGAGISTASGIKDFRSKDGLYSEKFLGVSPEEILSNNMLYNNPKLFYSYYKEKFLSFMPKPNAAHYYLSKLEKRGKLSVVITQNIDGLHQAAGSKNVIELHGSIFRNYTIKTGKRYDGIDIILSSKDVPFVDGEMLRPDVTLFGEALNDEVVRKAISAISSCDMLIIGGTSLSVYPAASFVDYYQGDKLIAINKDDLMIPNFIKGNITDIFNKLMELD